LARRGKESISLARRRLRAVKNSDKSEHISRVGLEGLRVIGELERELGFEEGEEDEEEEEAMEMGEEADINLSSFPVETRG
jgi:hypothetical protein